MVARSGRGGVGAAEEVLDGGGTFNTTLDGVGNNGHVVHDGVEDSLQAGSGLIGHSVGDGVVGGQAVVAGHIVARTPLDEVEASGGSGLGTHGGAVGDEGHHVLISIMIREGRLLSVVGEAYRTTVADVLAESNESTILYGEGVNHRVVVVLLAGLVDGIDVIGAGDRDDIAIRGGHTNHTGLGIDHGAGLNDAVAYLDIVGVLQGRSPVVEVNEGVAGEALCAPCQLCRRGGEVGRIGGILSSLNHIGGSGADLGASGVGPVHEVVTGGRRGGEDHIAQVVHGVGAADATGILVGAHGGDDVLVVVEVGGHRAVAQHLDGGAGSGGNSVVDAVAVPVREVVAILVGGIHRHIGEVVHGGGASDLTHVGVGADNGQGVLVEVEHGGVLDLALRHREGVTRSEDGVATLHPSHEVVAVVGRGGDGHRAVGMVLTVAGHSTHDVVVVQRYLEFTGIDEVGGKGLGGRGGVGDVLGGHGGGAIVPTGEAAAFGNSGGEVQHGAVLNTGEHGAVGHNVALGIGDATAGGIVSDGDVVRVDGEGGNQSSVRVSQHGNLLRGGAVAPAHKVVALGGSGGQSHRSHILGGGGGGSHSTHRLTAGSHRGGDGEHILGEVGLQRTGSVGHHIDGGIGAVHRVGFLPLDEHIAVVRRGGEGHRSQVVHSGAAADVTHGGIGAHTAHGIRIIGEVGGVGLVLGQGDSTRVVRVVVVPTGEVVAVVGLGTDLVVHEVLGGGHTAVDATHGLVGRDYGQHIHVGVEAGGEGAILGQGHSARVGRVVRVGRREVGPAGEVVTRGGSGADLVVLEVLGGGIAATDGTHAGALSGHIDGQIVGVDREVGVDGGVAHGGDVEDGLGSNLRTGHVGPVHEVVAGVLGGLVVGVKEVLDGGGTAHTTHRRVVHVDSHVVHVGVEVGDEGAVGVGEHIDGGIGTHHNVILRPVHEVVALLGSGGEGHRAVVVHLVRTCDVTHDGVGALANDRVDVVVEVGIYRGVAHSGNIEGVLGALLDGQHVVERIGPVHEVVAIVGCGHIVGVLEVLDGGGTRHGTHLGIVVYNIVGPVDRYVVLVGVEVGGESAVAVGVHDDGVLHGGLNGHDGHAVH